MKYTNTKGITFDVKHGDGVRFVDARDGVTVRAGKANGLLMFPGHLVVDVGGAHGTPAVVYPWAIIRVIARTAHDDNNEHSKGFA